MARPEIPLAELAMLVHREGVADAVLYQVSPEQIPDPQLASVWAEARDRLQEIERMLAASYRDE